MFELGADILIIPETDADTQAEIGGWIDIPVLVKLDTLPDEHKMTEIFERGCSGIVLTEKVLDRKRVAAKIESLKAQMHYQRSGDVSSAG